MKNLITWLMLILISFTLATVLGCGGKESPLAIAPANDSNEFKEEYCPGMKMDFIIGDCVNCH